MSDLENFLKPTGDLARLFSAHDKVERWSAERENATARLELARREENSAFLLSQHEPVATLGMDREGLRVLLAFLYHGDKARLNREIAALQPPTDKA
jgi:hypothetical protein